MLRGNSPAKLDAKGRIKIPTAFRKYIEEKFGRDCFITSTDGERAVIYPMPVWYDFQGRLAKVPSTSQAKTKLLERVNYFGQSGTIDAQGRVLQVRRPGALDRLRLFKAVGPTLASNERYIGYAMLAMCVNCWMIV